MRIICPHCQTKYDIKDSLNHKHLRCACCKGIWQPFAGSLEEITPAEDFIAHKYHSNKKFFTSLAIVVLFISASVSTWASYQYRFELINRFPRLEQIYKDFGISTYRKPAGDGLIFENITWSISEEDARMTINGTLKNTTNKDIEIPPLKLEFWNDNGYTIQIVEKELFHQRVKAGKTLDFKTYIDNPMTATKYIYIGFAF